MVCGRVRRRDFISRGLDPPQIWKSLYARGSRGGISVVISAALWVRSCNAHKNWLWARAVDWRKFCNKGLWRDQFLRDARAGWSVGLLPRRGIHAFCHIRKPQLRIEIHKCPSYMNPGVSPLRIPLPEQNQAFGPLRTMDDIIFYQPPSASKIRPLRLPGAVTASSAPRGPIASLSNRQTALQVNQQNGISKDQNESRDVCDLSQEGHASNRRCRNNTVQEQGTYRDLPSESLHLILWRKLDSNTKFPEQRRRRRLPRDR